jgi:hypothetical protein
VETSVGFPPGEYLGGFFTTSQAINSKVHLHDRWGTVDSFMISAAAHCVGVQVAVVYKSRLPPSIRGDPRVI